MEAQYDIQAIMRDLQATSELHPDQHDGSYELMRQTIQQYSRMADDSAWDYKDLNLVYLTTVGTWKQGLDGKLKTVQESHLPEESKAALASLWNSIWENAVAGKYSNSGMDASGKPSIGMFGTGFYSFQNKTTTGHVKAFIHMCVDILGLSDDNAMFDRAAPVLTASFQGMRSASASMILHCLKPFSFPVLNSNMGNYNIFEVLGVQLTKRDNIETYIDNCRKIKEFRDSNFSFKNYRVFDMAAWKVGEYSISEDKDKKAWLVTWNQNNWQWEDYRGKCAGTKKGESFVESWACASSSPKQGDEVFLIKLGEQPRGSIGHGTVVRESYEKDHYDPAKAAAGKKEKCIDVEFDRVQDYQTEKFIGQNVLQQECSDQHWSPQGSGIEIKPQVLPKLAALWQAITESDTDQWRPSLAEYDPGFTSADYKSFFLNPGVVKPEWLTSLYQMYLMPGHLATCKQLAERYGSTPSHYISFLSSTASRIERIGFSFTFDDIELQKLPGGINASAKNHRRYTHRGWNFSDYPSQMQKLWDQRKLILTATVNKELFGKDPGILKKIKWIEGLVYSEEACNEQCEAFCALVYYIHILGDYEEAKSYSSEFQQLIPLVRNPEDTTAPAMIDEISALIPILFDSQPWSTPVLIQELERIKANAEKIMFVQGGIRTQEQFDAYHECAMEVIEALEDYIPGMLKNTDFFSKAFY